jgi:hypothetical protein
MKSLRCRVGIHLWHSEFEWMPSIDAPIVTRWRFKVYCVRCGKVKCEDTSYFDEKTGAPLPIGLKS